MEHPVLLEMRGICKEFPGVKAGDDCHGIPIRLSFRCQKAHAAQTLRHGIVKRVIRVENRVLSMRQENPPFIWAIKKPGSAEILRSQAD